jgi:hypothetical protein
MTGLQLHTHQARLNITERQPLRLTGAAGARLRAVDGALWVTIDHDPRDQVLMPGDSLAIDSSRPMLVTALGGEATVSLCTPAAAPATNRHWWTRHTGAQAAAQTAHAASSLQPGKAREGLSCSAAFASGSDVGHWTLVVGRKL